MMYPILCKVRYETLHRVFQTRALWTQILFSVLLNWIVAPLLMVCPSPMRSDSETKLTHIGGSGVGISTRQTSATRGSYSRRHCPMYRHGEYIPPLTQLATPIIHPSTKTTIN